MIDLFINYLLLIKSFMKKRHEQKLIILSVALVIAFSIPISLLFNSEKEVFGYPMILVYLFAVWMISILISFVIVKKYGE
ncbi:hypothetical protein CHRY9390_03179 [Chryseobacterium aquaeductus]|uniref:Uncharacterized protein n=2 Tax=Chryseobacterium aquaeductus TaxID=2675056 RepID=A0A9N8QRU9_9FLAO|nr:hypothetical protein CHRY9390_03179 [Chryseobacterium potabilaquae]CAD7816487.1 hypothetical protein CHRY9390_03179 [Chryseobacterium aquaeductus]